MDSDSRSIGWFLGGIGIGVLLGVAVGVLFAPQSGKDTREQLRGKFDDLSSKLKDSAQELAATAKEKIRDFRATPEET